MNLEVYTIFLKFLWLPKMSHYTIINNEILYIIIVHDYVIWK
jgi:hypothetical protein